MMVGVAVSPRRFGGCRRGVTDEQVRRRLQMQTKPQSMCIAFFLKQFPPPAVTEDILKKP